MSGTNTRLIRSTLSTLLLVSILSGLASAAIGLKSLHSFTGGSNGFAPQGALAFDAAGNLYGTTLDGGNEAHCGGGCGIVFQLSPQTSGGWKFRIIYSFTGETDGSYPSGGVTLDAAGNIYGTTESAGTGGCGAVWELTPNGNTWTETTLYDFGNQPDGCSPAWGIILDSSGNLYGATSNGGPYNGGTVFQLVPQGDGTWLENILHAFSSGRDGYDAYSGVTMDSSGNLYGTTGGGIYGAGAVYQLSQSGGAWAETILFYFTGGQNGSQPYGGVVLDKSGNLYGTTEFGGLDNVGTVYELTPSSGFWKLTVLHNFSGGNDGGVPIGGVVRSASGDLYGPTLYGGYYEWGTIFRLAPAANGKWTETVLHSFANRFDGSDPQTGLSFDSAGNLYGTTQSGGADGIGAVFELAP